jgi:hypothetical protein
MPSNFSLHAGQTALSFLLVWLVTIAAMFIVLKFVNRWTRQELPWLHSPRAMRVAIVLTFATLALMLVLKPPPQRFRPNPGQATTEIK